MSSEEVVTSVLHDRQRFLVNEFVDWVVDDNGDVEVMIDWKYHTEDLESSDVVVRRRTRAPDHLHV